MQVKIHLGYYEILKCWTFVKSFPLLKEYVLSIYNQTLFVQYIHLYKYWFDIFSLT